MADELREIVEQRAILALTGSTAVTADHALAALPAAAASQAVWVRPQGGGGGPLARALFTGLGVDRRRSVPRGLGAVEDLVAAELRRSPRLVIVSDAHLLPRAALELLDRLWSRERFPLVLAGDRRLDRALECLSPALDSCVFVRHRLPDDTAPAPEPRDTPAVPAHPVPAAAPEADNAPTTGSGAPGACVPGPAAPPNPPRTPAPTADVGSPSEPAAAPAFAPATLHEARAALRQLIREAADGTPVPVSRDTDHAVLTTLAHAAALGWDTARADDHGIAEARSRLGDLVRLAAHGRPQVLRRHSTPVAVLLPAADTAGTAAAAAAFTPESAGPALAPAVDATALPAPVAAPPDTEAAAVPPTPAPAPQPTAGSAAPSPAPGTTDAAAPDAAPTPIAPDAAPVPATPVPAPGVAESAPDPGAALALRGRTLASFGQALEDVLTPTTGADTATPGVPALGIRALDEALGGLRPGRLHLIAAAPGDGASLIATAAARTTALDLGLPVLYAASGLSRGDVAARIVAAHLPVDYRRLRAGRLNTTEAGDVAILHGEIAAAPLYIDDGADLTAAAIAAGVADLPDLALVVVDRLQKVPDPRLPLSGPAAVLDAVQALIHLARTHDLPVVAVLDTDDPHLVAAASLDITLTLTRDVDRVHAAVAERDLGTHTTTILRADLAHARLTDLPTPPTAPGPPAPGSTPPDPAPPTAAPPWPPVTAPGTATRAPTTPPAPVPAASMAPRPERAHGNAPDAREQRNADAAVPTSESAPGRGARGPSRPSSARGTGYASRDYSHFTSMISRAVEEALTEHGGDVDAAVEALVKKAVPNGMALFEATRVGSNYEHTVYPELPEFLRKKTRDGVDGIWEGRHNWTNTALLDDLRAGTRDPVVVDVLDTNAAFLSAFKTHLPIGKLVHDPTGGYDPKRSGVYLLNSRPTWDHPHLPDPIGNRREDGEILLDDATLRLLLRCAALGLCQAPVIAESWTSGASEGLLEKFRRVLTEVRENALKAGDVVTVEYVKAMYSKFVSTMGESSANRDIRRPEWMHIIRSQAFANLWRKGYRAHENGLTIVRMRGVDELHVTGGDWRAVFDEGRSTAQTKSKEQYTLPGKAA
ncbi:hypothetical protein B4N89_44780 [Embleya scabrispora]|uniref:SF4 helicase domain-containing protein n=1 Tax=Embleya scabrispora TaxID=159449 RepID=A0A1T3NIV1_9ACTN|nr:hypothetical protein B4N89_44780 [Embleya scabrispora]